MSYEQRKQDNLFRVVSSLADVLDQLENPEDKYTAVELVLRLVRPFKSPLEQAVQDSQAKPQPVQMNVADAARYFKIPPSKLYAAIRSGHLNANKVGHNVLVFDTEVQDLLELVR